MAFYTIRDFIPVAKDTTATGTIHAPIGGFVLQEGPLYFGPNREFRIKSHSESGKLRFQKLVDGDYVTLWELPEV